jgi:uncharacterized protein (TIGR03663 family)
MTAELAQQSKKNRADGWLDRPVFSFWPTFSIEKLLIVLLIILTIFSRFYDLGARVMSHDEVNHVISSYDLYQGRGYRYDPVTHGPFQFHMVAFSYFMFGDSDFSARIPAALFGVAIVIFTIFAWRRYLGRIGALIGGLFFAISPYMLFYSRYTRNEIFIVFWGLVMLWLFLRYLECGETKFLIGLAVITGFHYADKATSYIFSAEALIFLAIFFVYEVMKRHWRQEKLKSYFSIILVIALIAGAAGAIMYITQPDAADAAQALAPSGSSSTIVMVACFGIALVGMLASLVILLKGLPISQIRALRSFDLLILQISLILPLLSALVIKILGFDPLDYSEAGMMRAAAVIVPLGLLSVFIGLLWNRKVWLKCALVFWGIFIIFYTTVFTQGDGFFVGIVGALGYWMSQQTVERGTQPLYYYALVQIPMYEFLPAIGTIFALIVGIAKGLFFNKSGHPFEAPEKSSDLDEEAPLLPLESNNQPSGLEEENVEVDLSTEAETPPKPKFRLFTDPPDHAGEIQPVPTLLLLLFWSLISLIAFSLAGERMPWLTTHIAMPLILSAAWGLGYFVESTDWAMIVKKKGLLVFAVGLIFILAASNALGSLMGANPPFQGKELPQLQATSTFLLAGVASLASIAGLIYLLKGWRFLNFLRLLLCSFFLILTVITVRTAYRAAYINYDNAKEFLVYAHATRDMKDVLEQVENISKRLYGDKSINVAYDNDSNYPFWWYFRDYPNKNWYNITPTKDLRNAPIILVGNDNFSKVEPIVADKYYQFNYKRMWWPMEDYRNQTLQSVWNMLKDPVMREALWQIWFNRDYTQYATATESTSLTLATWSPAEEFRMYIRKDIAAQIWEYGLAPEPVEPKVDPYASGTISLEADKVISLVGDKGLSYPRDIAIAPDGSMYVADAGNHRIVHLDSEGNFLNAWGSYANVLEGSAPQGMFNEPWGVAVSQDGYVYVADTWNHRIQKFTSDGEFVTMWDTFGSADTPDSFWGPRGVAVDSMGRVYVTDTGKQRVVIFDENGKYVTQFGGLGFEAGQFDEPVGVEVNAAGLVFIADTWNNRIQIFAPSLDFMTYTSILSWEVDAWNSQSLDNKPFLAINADDQIFVSDPSTGKVLQFDGQGNFLQLWGGYDNTTLIGIASGIAVDDQGRVWVSDSLNNTLLRFNPPTVEYSPSFESPLETIDGD